MGATAISFLSFACCAPSACGIESGDQVVIVSATPLTSDRKKIAELTPGTVVTIAAVGNDHLEVSAGKLGRISLTCWMPMAQALDHFSAAIEKDSRNAAMLLARGKVQYHLDEFDKAIIDFDESLKLAATSEAHMYRGWTWKRKGDNDRALKEYDEAIQMDKANALAWRLRGAVWAARGNFVKALADYNESVRLDPNHPLSLNHRTLLLAACPDANIRNGKQAVADATKMCELTQWKQPLFIANLAMAYAEAGDFDRAIHWHQKAVEDATPALAKLLEERLKLYRQQRPYRMTW